MLENVTKENLLKIKSQEFKLKLEDIKGNFIPTKEAKERLQKIKHFFDSGIPVMLEGPTGTSKTKTIQVLCDILNKKLIRFNLNNETTIEDLIGRLNSCGEDSWSSFKFVPGPFTEAFEKGYVLLLDEVNLGQKSVLQCMESALDTGEIIQDIPGCGTIKKVMNKDFILVATQNPKIEGFSNQREELSQKFLSRFTVVEFPSFDIEELRNIAIEIAKKNNYKKLDIVKKISDLHYQWVYQEKDSNSSPQCFTVRDINSTIKAISEGQEPGDAINCFYGSRYRGKEFDHLMEIIKKNYTNLYKNLTLIPELPDDFPECYSNFAIKKVFYFANIAKKNGRHILIVGQEGSGLTQVSKWISWYFTPKEKRKENFIFIFSPETTVSDMIGKYTPKSDAFDSTSGIFEWRDGPLTLAVKEGYSGVFDNISSAQAKVIESLNNLLDLKDTEEDYYFEIPQNTSEPRIKIHKDFFFVANCTLDQMDKLSPAFLNRFTVINLDDQLNGLSEEQEKEVIKHIMESEAYEFDENDDEFIKSFHNIYKENNLNMSSLSTFIRATVKLLNILKNINDIDDKKKVVLYMRDLILTKKIDIDIPNIIENKASSIFDKYEPLSNEERFYFQNSPNLRNLMTNLYVCSLCRIHTCLVGATGLGKTSMARAFCEIVRREYANFYSFHMETQLSDLFGVFNFESGKPVIQDGPLVKAMENGQIFIADELNLAEDTVLQTMNIALEPSDEDSIFLVPDTGKKIKKKNSFFFIACQNDVSTSGRRKLPKIIQKRLRNFEYPLPMIKDLQNSIEEMTRFEINKEAKFKLYFDFPSRIANFMYQLNKANFPEIGKWSMRNIRKLYRRITNQQISDSSYLNITIEHQIVFYILGSVPGGVEEKLLVYDKIAKILQSTFDLKEELYNKIRNCIESKPRILEINKKKFLVKGDSQKTLEDKEKKEKLKPFTHAIGEAGILLDSFIEDKIKIDLSSLCETFFYILFSHYKEPLLLCGPSGYKSKLAKDISSSDSVINFYPEISNSQLIGNVSLVTNYQAKEYYLEQICKICNKEQKLQELKDKLNDYYEEKKKEAIRIREKKLREQRMKTKEGNKKEDSDEDSSESESKKRKKKNNYEEEDEDDSSEEQKTKKNKKNKRDKVISNDDDSSEDEKKKNKKKINSEESSDYIKDVIKNVSLNEKDKEMKINKKDSKNIKINFNVIKKFEEKINKIVNDSKKDKKLQLPKCFVDAIERLKKNLIKFDVSFSEGIFGDFTSIFKTGILTSKIFNQSSLIAENLPNLPTAVIERCNELLNYNPKITLSEDTCNSFTGEDKELKDFADGFRVIATSTELAIRNLSDAALSRFTVIYTTSYSPEERDLLIQIFYQDTPKEFYDFLKDYKVIFKKELSFLYVTKILNILKLIDLKFDKYEREKDETRKKNLCLAIHSSLRFLMDNQRKKKNFKNIVNNILPGFYSIKDKKVEDENENEIEDKIPFEFLDGKLHSNFSNLSITSVNLKEDDDCHLAFIKPFNKLLRHIFLSIAIHYPLIIEGGTGKGKKSAIYYMAKILGYEVVYFNISNNTTVDDLFCKKMPIEKDGNLIFVDIRSLLLDGIDVSKEKEKDGIIILDNLQLANPNLLEGLIPLFNKDEKSTLVQGEEINKRLYNIIGIIDTSMDSKNANDFLPDAIKYSTILYKNSKYLKRKYCRKIIDKMFGEEINEENEPKIEYYLNSYIKLNNYVNKKQLKELFTFNDFKKFLFFLKNSRTDVTDPNTAIFDIQTITQLLLVYKFKSKDEINSANQILGNSLASDFWPIFSYLSDDDEDNEPERDEFQIAPDNKGENLSYETKIILSQKQRQELLLKTHSLTPDQRRGIIFLMLSVLSDVPCVIQGTTASGKTHLIRLFCELLGRKPLIIDINNDTGISLLLKQLVPKEKLEERAIKRIQTMINYLIQKEPEVFGDNIYNIIDLENENNWLPSQFKNLVQLLEQKSIEINNDNLIIASDLKSLLNEQLSFFRHLSNEDSSFIKAMINGDWVILDGIESAQPELYQRLSSLCDLENQNLTMYDNGPEYIYTKNAKNERFKIHKDFRLFITYNPFEVESGKILPQSFLNKCLTFNLSPIDENMKTTSLVLSGLFNANKLYKQLEKDYFENNEKKLKRQMPSLRKYEIINNLLKEDLRVFAIKFANIHHYSNNLVEKNKEDFAGQKNFSGRSLKFIINSLKAEPDNINKGIIRVIQDIYCYPYKKSQIKLKEDLINKFMESPLNELMQFLRNDEVIAKEKYKTIINDLKMIKENPDVSFDMCQFITTTFAYIYKDIKLLIEEIEKCLSSLDIENINYTYLFLLKIILQNYKERKGSNRDLEKNLKKKNINDLVLSQEDEYLQIPQNLLFVYQALLERKLIKKISFINYFNYLKFFEDNNESENEVEENSDDPLKKIYKNEKKYMIKKGLKGEKLFVELCLDDSNLVGNLATLAIGYPELNDKSKEKLEELLKNLREFDKNLFILFIKLFNNSKYDGNKEELMVCEKFCEFLKQKEFVEAVEDTYKKEDLLKGTNPKYDQLLIEQCSKIKKELNSLSQKDFICCINEDYIVKSILSEWNDNFEKYKNDLDEAYSIKTGNEKELRLKKKFELLIDKLKAKKSKISNNFIKGLLNDMIDHLNSITIYNEENYANAEIDVNNILRDSEGYHDSSSKTIYIHFPIVEYDDEYKPKGDFQKIYTLLMSFTDCKNLLKEFETNEDKRTCMNLGKLKKYLKIQEESTFESMKIQYNILYDKIMSHSDKILDCIQNFEECLLSDLLMNIYNINKDYLNPNLIIEKLNHYCERNKMSKEKNEIDLEWASFLSKSRDPFDEIILPQYTSSAIIKLFTLKNEKNEDDEGIFSINLMNNYRIEFYKKANELLLNKQMSNLTTIKSIFKIVIETIFTDKENVNNVESIQKIFKEKFIEKDKIENIEIINLINEIKDKIHDDINLIKLLDFISNLFLYFQFSKGKENNDYENIIDINNIPENKKELLMDDIFFIKNENWKDAITSEYKMYPSLLYFLFKYPKCEEELRQFLKKTDSIKNSDNNKFPTFLLIFRIFSDLNCLKLDMRTDTFLGNLIQDELISQLKSKTYDNFKNSSDINWLGLIINNSEISKIVLSKVNYLYNYLENLCSYSFKPSEESKGIYKIIIQKMIKSLLRIIFEGKIDSLFSTEIPKIEKEEDNLTERERVNNDILYFTKLPKIIQIIIKEENMELEKNFLKKFKENIKSINSIYTKNENLYRDFINAIETDIEEEKNRFIKADFKKKKNNLESECQKRTAYSSGYSETINILNDSKLSLEEYNKLIIKAINAEEYLIKIHRNYFTREIKHTYVKLTFRNDCKKGTLKFGNISQEISNIKTKSCYYINSKILNNNNITITTVINNSEENIKFDKEECRLCNINRRYVDQELIKSQTKIEELKPENEKDINVVLTISKNQITNLEKIKTNNNFQILEKIMGENGLKRQLKKAIEIENKKLYNINDIKLLIKEFKNIFNNLKDLEFQTPKFENQLGPPTMTINFCDKYKNEFKDLILEKLLSLIQAYDNYDSLKQKAKINLESFDESFSINIFEKNRPKIKELKINKTNKFTINYPYLALLKDTETDIQKLQFGYSSYNLTIGPIITSLYKGTKFTYNIISFVDKILTCKLIFDEDKIDKDSKTLIPFISIKQKIPSSEQIPITFTVPSENKNKNYSLKGYLEIKIDGSEIEPLLVEFNFNIILLPLEIYFTSDNYGLYWEKDRFYLKNDSFREKEILNFNYLIRNFEQNYSFLNQNYSLKSLGQNEVENFPKIIQNQDKKNFFNINMPFIYEKQESINCLLKLYFTPKLNIPLEILGKLNKVRFKVFYYDPIYNIIEENKANIYVYKHFYKGLFEGNNSREIEMNFRVQILDEGKHKLEVVLPYNGYGEKISFYIKSDGKIIKNIGTIESLEGGTHVKIIANFHRINSIPKLKKISFCIDDERKDIIICIKKEEAIPKPEKIFNFPYKTIIDGEYKMINKNNFIEIEQKQNPIVYYSPYSVKIYEKTRDIIAKPGEFKSGNFMDSCKLIIFVKELNNYWVPNVDFFGFDYIDNYKILSNKEENIGRAKEKILIIFNEIRERNKIFSFGYNSYEEVKNKGKNELNKYNNFLDFIYWLISDDLKFESKIGLLNDISMKMGSESEELKNYINSIKETNSSSIIDTMEDDFDKNEEQQLINEMPLIDEKFYPIIYYNIIILLRRILKKKYDFLKRKKFNISKILRFYKKRNYKENIKKAFPLYDAKKFAQEVLDIIKPKIDENITKKKLSKYWLFNELESVPKSVNFEEIKIKDDFINQTKMSEGMNFNLNLDILKIKDLSLANSLDKIISVLNNGFFISKAFIFCLGKLEEEKINEIFNYLYEIYHMTKDSTNSILSAEINLFKISFENLCRSLKGSGVNLSKFEDLSRLTKDKSNIILNEEKPVPKLYSFQRGIIWKGSNLYYRKYEYDKEDEEKNVRITINEGKKSDKEVLEKNKKIEEKKSEQKNETPNEEENKIDFENKGIHSDEESDDEIKKIEKIHLKRTENVVEITEEEINKLKSISDEDVTNAIIKKMLKKRIDANLKLPDSFPEFKSDIYGDRDNILKKTINRKEGIDYINQPLYSLLNNISKNIYIKFIQNCNNFDKSEVCGVIALDLCRTIDKKFKLFHTLIANAMANYFNTIEIPYSIVVFCDFGVQFIIKDFEEAHQEDISQLIFDSIMVPRCSTRIANACYFISQKVVCKDRPYKKVFVISNGLDTKLKIGEKWAPIFSNEKEKFCFYFVKPNLKNDLEENEIIKIWEDFKEKTKTELAIISQEDIINNNSNIYIHLKNVMQIKENQRKELSQRIKMSQPEFKEVIEFKKSDFIHLLESINEEIITIKDYFVQNRIHVASKGKYKLEDIKVKNPFLSLQGKCYDEDYNFDKIDKDSKLAIEKLFSNPITSEMKLEYIEFIFTPNKPSMFSPSSKGTRLYLMGLINFCITHGQDNKIWLEKNKGLKKDYRVTVIIDSSISCFNDYMRPHSIKTVLAVLRMLSLVEIPFFDLIIATPTNPIVLSCGNDTINSLNFKSILWNIVLEQLTFNEEGCNLLDCLKLVYKLKSMNNVKKYYTFVLTDGMFDQKESEEIKDYISFCEESSIEVFGIGLGYYPEGIKEIFDKCLWSLNPFMILKALTVFFGSGVKHLEILPLISFETYNISNVLDQFKTIITNFNSYQEYKTLYGFLDGLPLLMESLDEITNPDLADEIGSSNPEILNSNTMCSKGEFEGFKILIGQFWSCELSKSESEWVNKKYLLNRYDKNKECLKEVLDYYSIEIVIKEDYKECIKELQTGKYYAHWIICSDNGGKLPNGGNANLIGQYIDALKIFWINGGSLIFWNDNEPFTTECNLFLEQAEFPGEISKTKVRFGGNHDGKKMMKPGDISFGIGDENEFGKFNNKRLFNDGKYPMFSLAHNLIKINEGNTISYVQDKDNISPFNIFGYEHQGGINVLFYTPPFKYNHGYIILEGGFTKLFNELDTDGTKRYVLNIAAFTTQFAKRFGEIGENWKTNFKLPSFDINLDETVIWKGFDPNRITNDFDIVYLLDATGSMGNYLAAAREQCISISDQLRKELPQFDFNFGAVFYRDPIDCPGEKNHTYSLKSDVNLLKMEIGKETASGGGDGPEDWVGGYDLALNNIAWRNGTRLIIHIADAPAHGSEWCNKENHESENLKLYEMIQKCVDKKIKIIGFQIGKYPLPSFSKFENEYKSRGGILYKICPFSKQMNSKEISQHFKDMVIESTHVAAPKLNKK